MDKLEEDLEHIYQHTQDLWKSLSGKTIFVTGGTGFFGIWLQMSFVFINRKQNLNANMIILTRNKNAFFDKYPFLSNNPEVSFVEGDICSFTFFNGSVDFIIHAATEASVKLNLEAPLMMFHTIVDGSKRILDFAVEKKVASFLFTSSGAVYGKQPATYSHIPEDYSGAPETSNPASVYGEAKRMAEVLCAVYHQQFLLPIKIARCFAFVGPFLPLDTHFAIGNFIFNLIRQEDIIVKGDGSPLRSYLYASDLAIWLWTILFKGDDIYPYNVGSDDAISIEALANLIANYNPSRNTQVFMKGTSQYQSERNYVPSIARAQSQLELKVSINRTEAIKKTIDFYSQAK